MLKLIPLKDYANVNIWDYSDRIRIINGNQNVFYVQLATDEGKPYHPVSGSVLSLTFPRAKTLAQVPQSQDVTVSLVQASPLDNSIYSFSLTSSQSNTVVSGGIVFTVTESGIVRTYKTDNIVEKII